MFVTTDMTSTQVSVQFSRSVMSDSLRPHESQHTRAPCPSPTPGVHSDSCPSSQWCHPAISSSVVPFSSCPRSLPATESFPMSQLFAWGGQSTGVSALSSLVHPIWSFSLDLSSITTFNQKKIQFPWISERRSNREDFHKTTGTCLPGTKHSKAIVSCDSVWQKIIVLTSEDSIIIICSITPRKANCSLLVMFSSKRFPQKNKFIFISPK